MANVALSSCGGRHHVGDLYTWSSENPAVAQVASATGQVTAIGPGQTNMRVTGTRYGALGYIRITVAPAP